MEPEGSLPCSLRAKSPSLAPILSQINPVHNSPHYFPKIHSNIITHLGLGLPGGLLLSGFLTNTLNAFLNYPMRATCPVPFHLLDFITLIIFREAYNQLLAIKINNLLQNVTQTEVRPKSQHYIYITTLTVWVGSAEIVLTRRL